MSTPLQMLVNGTALTAIGELTISPGGENMKISAPSDGRSYFLTKSNFASLLKEIENEAKFLKRLLAVRTLLLLACNASQWTTIVHHQVIFRLTKIP